MTLTEMLNSSIAERVVWTLAHFLWQGGAIAALVLLAAWLVGSDVRRRYWLSALGMAAMGVCPIIMFVLLQPAQRTTQIVNVDEAQSLGASEIGLGVESGVLSLPLGMESQATTAAGISRYAPWLLAAWLAGVAILSMRLLLGVVAIAWLKRTGQVAGEIVQGTAARLCERLNLRLPQIRVSRRVSEAMAIGLFRPVIVLPAAWLLSLPPDCLEAVLAHELAHIRRRDLWVNLLQRIVETLLFYHPAVWWLSSRLRHEREMCCDELAVSLTGRRVEYASTLELVARRRLASGTPALAAGIGGGKMALLNRVRNILGLAPAAGGASPWTIGAGALIVAGACWWIASGVSPLAALAQEREGHDAPEVTIEVDEEGEVRSDGDRQRGEGEERRDGDRPRGEGERERPDGDRPRAEGERDRPQGAHVEEFRRRIEEMRAKVRAAAEAGRREEAEAGERQIREMIQKFEQLQRGGDRPQVAELPPEVRAKLEDIKRRHREAAEAGRREEAQELERQAQAIMREHGPRDVARPALGDMRPEVRERLEALHRQLRELSAAEKHDAAAEVKRQIHEILQAQAPRPEGDRPRGEGDRPRVEGDRPRVEGDRPQPRDAELMEAIRQLREEVGRLRREVDELRGGRREGDRPRADGDRPREGDRVERDPRPVEDGRERPRPDARPDGDR